MVTFIFIILIMLLLAAGIFLFVQYNIQLNIATGKTPLVHKPRFRVPLVKKADSSDTNWRAVKVKTGLMCCKEAEKMRGQIYLAAEAPVFPIKGCKVAECECKYIHKDDRRDGDERRESTEFLNDLYGMHDKDRRKTKGRRKSDL